MNAILHEYLNRFIVVYIDNILIYSSNRNDHIRQVKLVLQCLLEHHLYLKAEKCQFHLTTMHFLGYVIGPKGVQMVTAIIQAICSWPQSSTLKELQHFLGFANVNRWFIHNFSTVIAPVTSLLKGKPKNLPWTPEATEAFQQHKKAFTSAPILGHPDPNLPFVLEVDTSTQASSMCLLLKEIVCGRA
ncbi:uncharacterized protein LOC127452685 [Myxocyprinus asiaticus]|uniref:uncharacterized protein LOC127452685 n=1 Tax=Myxocyprinus asiaticus TaxID=70543 RepID=UPI00222363F1|nr:uncharacterized protein LOC127452685 [Myxocyprinus asiaticus]